MGEVIRIGPGATVVFDEAGAMFGQCSVCRPGYTEYLNIGKRQYGLCEKHRICWVVGEGICRHWKTETLDDWRRNAGILQGLWLFDPNRPRHLWQRPIIWPDLRRLAGL